jgi:hypothetical protein
MGAGGTGEREWMCTPQSAFFLLHWQGNVRHRQGAARCVDGELKHNERRSGIAAGLCEAAGHDDRGSM